VRRHGHLDSRVLRRRERQLARCRRRSRHRVEIGAADRDRQHGTSRLRSRCGHRDGPRARGRLGRGRNVGSGRARSGNRSRRRLSGRRRGRAHNHRADRRLWRRRGGCSCNGSWIGRDGGAVDRSGARRDRDRGGRLSRAAGRRRAGRGLSPRRKQRLRIDVALILVGVANAELHVRPGNLGVSARADSRDHITLGDRRALCHRDRSELRQRHRPPVGGEDRQRLPIARNRPRKRDQTPGGGLDGRPGIASDIDPSMLARRVWAGRIERERKQHRASGRPCPCRGGSDRHERHGEHGEAEQEQGSTHREPPLDCVVRLSARCRRVFPRTTEPTSAVVSCANVCSPTIDSRPDVVNTGYSVVTKTSGRARCARHQSAGPRPRRPPSEASRRRRDRPLRAPPRRAAPVRWRPMQRRIPG
jgi:hypothetical protein